MTGAGAWIAALFLPVARWRRDRHEALRTLWQERVRALHRKAFGDQ